MRKLHKILTAALLSSALLLNGTYSAAVAQNANSASVQLLLDGYGSALNSLVAAKVAPFFTVGGEVAAPGLPTADGRTEIESLYKGIFKAISLALVFTPANITIVSEDYAFATSTSSGPVTVLSTKQTTANKYRELWILKKENGEWKINNYYFNQL